MAMTVTVTVTDIKEMDKEIPWTTPSGWRASIKLKAALPIQPHHQRPSSAYALTISKIS
jgi:hypothetical protein